MRESLTLNNVVGLTMSAAAFGVLAAVLVLAASLAVGVGLVRARRRAAEARAEVSIGYTCMLELAEGEVGGEAFDFEQRSIRADHVWVEGGDRFDIEERSVRADAVGLWDRPPSASSSNWLRPTLHGLLVVLALGLAGCEASEGASAAALVAAALSLSSASLTLWLARKLEPSRPPGSQEDGTFVVVDPAEANKAWVIKGPLAAPPQHQGTSEAPAAPEDLKDLLRAKIAEQRAELAERTGLPATAFATKEEMTFGWTRDDGEVSFDAALAEMAGKPLEERESARPDAKPRPGSTAFFALPLLATLGACGPTFVIWDSGDGDGDPGTAEPGIPDLPDESTETDETEVPPDMPGDGDGDSTCEPGTMYCVCSHEDLNEDGEIPAGGECFPDLVCDAVANVCIEAGGVGSECSVDSNECATGLSCINGYCNVCPDGLLNCACDEGTCSSGLVCVKSNDGTATICAPTGFDEPCDHMTGLDLPGVLFGVGCVAGCTQGESCGWLECSPIDAFAEGFCAWPIDG